MICTRDIARLVSALSLVTFSPVAAAEEWSTGITGRYTELSRTQTADLFHQFRALETEDRSAVRLWGLVPTVCIPHVRFENSVLSTGSGDTPTRIGVRVLVNALDSDTDGTADGIKCLTDHRNDCRNSPVSCSRISEANNTTIEIAARGRFHVVLSHPDRDTHSAEYEDFDPALNITGRETVAERERERRDREARDARTARERELRRRVRTCADASALAELRTFGIARSEIEDLEWSLAQQEIRSIDRCAERGRVEELEACRDRLIAWAEEHPDHVDYTANIFRKIAERYVNRENPTVTDFRMADDTLAEGLEFDLSAGNTSTLSTLRNLTFPVEQGRMMAMSGGWETNFRLPYYYSSLVGRLQNHTMRSCSGWSYSYGSSYGTTVDMDSCAGAMTALRSAAAIPELGMRVDRQNYAMQMQIFQMMNGGGGLGAPGYGRSFGPGVGGFGGGMGGFGGPSPLSVPGPGGGTLMFPMGAGSPLSMPAMGGGFGGAPLAMGGW